jgi:coenzyme F420-reducing hydrogenase beta subunit
VYAAKNLDENIRSASSSGGIFSLLGAETIREGGVVFGACFDEDWTVKHDYTETLTGLARFRGSKYTQSRMENAYRNVRQFLNEGRKVLFSGTPCQVAGLKQHLRREYENLLTVDFVCHGVPSPKVWRNYLKECAPKSMISGINFRDKQKGWQNYSFVLKSKDGKIPISHAFHEDTYMRGFLSDLYLRPSCHRCQFREGKSRSDITIGDYWGIKNVLPDFDDNKGCSLVMVNTEKGMRCYPTSQTETKETSYEAAIQGNPSIVESTRPHPHRERFFAKIDKAASCSKWIERCLKPSFVERIKGKIKRIMKGLRG